MKSYSVSRIARYVIILGLGVLCVLIATPYFVSTKRVYEPFVRSLAEDKLQLEVGSVSIGWFRPIEIHDVVISDLDSQSTSSSHIREELGTSSNDVAPEARSTNRRPKLLRIKSIKSSRGILGHFFSGRHIGRVTITEPKIDISLLEDTSNLQRLVDSLNRAQSQSDTVGSSSSPKEFPAIDFEIAILNASVHVQKVEEDKPLVVIPPFSLTAAYHGLVESPNIHVQSTKLLDRVLLTPELVKLGLGKAVPLLAKSTWFDGSVSLDLGELTIPLREPINSRGSATIQMHQVRTGPSEPLLVKGVELIAKLRNKEPALELVFVDGSNIEIQVAEQRVHHSGLQAGLPKIDERLQISSNGSVGLQDKSLDLVLEIPVPVEQIARRDRVKELGVPRIHIPVKGTLESPQVQLEALRQESGAILALMSGKLQDDAPILSSVIGSLGGVAEGDADEAIQATVDVIRAIRDARNQSKQSKEAAEYDAPKENGNQQTPPADRPKRPILDALRQALE